MLSGASPDPLPADTGDLKRELAAVALRRYTSHRFSVTLASAALSGLIAWTNAAGAKSTLMAAAAPPQAAVSEPAPAPFGDLEWRLLGPFRGGWSEMVAGIPNQPDVFLFGAAGGGVWRTDNAGRTWRSLFDHGPAAPVGAIAIAPSDPNTIYIGTGQPEPRYDVAGGDGAFKSIDGGRTWSALGLNDTRSIGRIWVHPTNAKVVLVAAVGHFLARMLNAACSLERRRYDMDARFSDR